MNQKAKIECHCCTSNKKVKQCSLENCDYPLCSSCKKKVYNLNTKCPNCRREIIRLKLPGFFLDACAFYMPVNYIGNESVLPVHPVGFPEHILFGVLQNLRLLLFI